MYSTEEISDYSRIVFIAYLILCDVCGKNKNEEVVTTGVKDNPEDMQETAPVTLG